MAYQTGPKYRIAIHNVSGINYLKSIIKIYLISISQKEKIFFFFSLSIWNYELGIMDLWIYEMELGPGRLVSRERRGSNAGKLDDTCRGHVRH